MPSSTSNKSINLAFKFFSLNQIAPAMNDTITPLRRTRDTMEIIESS